MGWKDILVKKGVEGVIKKVAPTVSKELSQKAKAWRVRGFFDRMQSKLKTEEQEKFTKAYKKWKKKK